jgi:hypothetical protein
LALAAGDGGSVRTAGERRHHRRFRQHEAHANVLSFTQVQTPIV